MLKIDELVGKFQEAGETQEVGTVTPTGSLADQKHSAEGSDEDLTEFVGTTDTPPLEQEQEVEGSSSQSAPYTMDELNSMGSGADISRLPKGILAVLEGFKQQMDSTAANAKQQVQGAQEKFREASELLMRAQKESSLQTDIQAQDERYAALEEEGGAVAVTLAKELDALKAKIADIEGNKAGINEIKSDIQTQRFAKEYSSFVDKHPLPREILVPLWDHVALERKMDKNFDVESAVEKVSKVYREPVLTEETLFEFMRNPKNKDIVNRTARRVVAGRKAKPIAVGGRSGAIAAIKPKKFDPKGKSIAQSLDEILSGVSK